MTANLSDLRCMAVQQPWASLLVTGVKPVENRESPMPSTIRGQWCAIYASLTLAQVARWIWAMSTCRSRDDWPFHLDVRAARKEAPRGHIVGLLKWSECHAPGTGSKSPWRDRSQYGWHYSDRIALARPVPLEGGGRQSLVWRLTKAQAAGVLGALTNTDASRVMAAMTPADFVRDWTRAIKAL